MSKWGNKRCKDCGHRWTGAESICPECEAWGYAFEGNRGPADVS